MQEAYSTNYELVYIAEKNKVIYDGKTFADILKSFADASILERYGEDFFIALTDVSPLLSITMSEMSGIDINAWDVNQVIPIVPVLNEQNAKWLLFKNGQKQEQPLQFRNDYYDDDYPEFDEPVIGIWESEGHYLVRMDGMTSFGISIENYMPGIEGQKSICLPTLQAELSALIPHTLLERNGYYLIHHNTLVELYNNCLGLVLLEEDGGGGGGGTFTPPCAAPCQRDCETLPEMLEHFKINGWGVFENIRNQIFENTYVFHGDVVDAVRNSFGQITPHILKYVSVGLSKSDLLNCGRGPCQGRWVSTNHGGNGFFLVWSTDWDLSNFGDPYYIDWAEVDNGSTTVSFGVGLNAKFKIGDNTEVGGTVNATISRVGSAIVQLGRQSVNYCEPIRKPIETGSVTFKVN